MKYTVSEVTKSDIYCIRNNHLNLGKHNLVVWVIRFFQNSRSNDNSEVIEWPRRPPRRKMRKKFTAKVILNPRSWWHGADTLPLRHWGKGGDTREPDWVIWLPKLLHFTLTYTEFRETSCVIPHEIVGGEITKPRAVDFCLNPEIFLITMNTIQP